MGDKDKQLKQERGYHGKSYVRNDGSEVLLDKLDWDVRKHELWKRAGERCEYNLKIRDSRGFFEAEVRCAREGIFPCHIEPRHPRRDDRLSNLKLGCKECAEANEKQSWRKTRFGDHKPFKKRSQQP
jgi:hypothetical protein